MSFYSYLKLIHISCAVLSMSGFILRGIWMLYASPLMKHPLTRRVPHVIDSILLVTALVMVYLSAQYPFVLDWLTAKVIALLLYIFLGLVAFRLGKTQTVRIIGWLLAISVFIYIVLVALGRSVIPFIT